MAVVHVREQPSGCGGTAVPTAEREVSCILGIPPNPLPFLDFVPGGLDRLRTLDPTDLAAVELPPRRGSSILAQSLSAGQHSDPGSHRSLVSSALVFQEPSNKRVRSLGRVTSLASLISPVKNGAVRRFGQTIQVRTCPPTPSPCRGFSHTGNMAQ